MTEEQKQQYSTLLDQQAERIANDPAAGTDEPADLASLLKPKLPIMQEYPD